jgi:L-amino acid N-acyltransferase YncA
MSPNNILSIEYFADIDFQNNFFDSLRGSYQEFDAWASAKSETGASAYVFRSDDGKISGFLYLKAENGPVNDISPVLNCEKCLKVGTFKVDAHGTRIGERFVKKVFDHALSESLEYIYTTVFPQHEPLINILKRYGFQRYGRKETANGTEIVFLKKLDALYNDPLLDYPVVKVGNHSCWLLSIWPKWHTRLFPDSILNTENASIVEDLSFTNSIHKVYIAYMNGMENIQRGDCLVIYRTREAARPAWYTSVATSICVVEETRSRSSFSNQREFIQYSESYSVFTPDELAALYNKSVGNEMHAIKMTYNVALTKRPNRQKLIEEIGLNQNEYWGFMPISPQQLKAIVRAGEADESIIID